MEKLRLPDTPLIQFRSPSTVMLFIWAVIGVNYCGSVDSASIPYMMECETDYQCPDGYYCFTQSHTCARCLECAIYKRTSSWRHCPKVPADCGKCLPEYEEEILAEGKTRDFCIESVYTPMHHTVQTTFSANHVLIVGFVLFLVPILFYAFCWKKRTQRHFHCQHTAVPSDEPPPYLSIEPTPNPSVSDSMEAIEEEIVTNISQTKDRLTEATPFRRPNYEDDEDAYNREEDEPETDEGNSAIRIHSTNLELEDENTMPSNWTPDREYNSNQLESELQVVVETEDEECCQPSNKRRREDPDVSNSPQQQQQQQQQTINVFVNNIIMK